MKKIIFSKKEQRLLTTIFYTLIGIVSSLSFFLVLYWALRLDSAITNVITNTSDTPLYFWPYVLLTFGAIVLFGINMPLLVYRIRKFGFPKLRTEGGLGAGSLVGVAASACPVCGSTLLSAIGIAGGLAAFPLQGLELKALSFLLLALPIWFIRKDLKKRDADCKSGACPRPKNHLLKEADRPWFFGLIFALILLVFVSINFLKSEPIFAKILNQNTGGRLDGGLLERAMSEVLPENGFQSKIALNDSVIKLVQYGVIDSKKFLDIYRYRGELPAELKNVLDLPSSKPIRLTRQNAGLYVNLLWPLGLSNYMSSNKKSPVNRESLFHFASTGGWNLGEEENGGSYFNKFIIFELTPEQEALVTKIADNAYRPCCNNSTFYQDCNHGSALLGLLELGASQGLTEEELWREALAFNSFWFPHQYVQTALYFKAAENRDWGNVDPKLVLGKTYSSASGWYSNVDATIKKLGLLPQEERGTKCGA